MNLTEIAAFLDYADTSCLRARVPPPERHISFSLARAASARKQLTVNKQ